MRARQGQFILMAVTVAALVLVLLLEGCSTATAPSPTAGTAGEQTKPYGSLTIAGQFGNGQLDPQIASGSAFVGIGNTIFDTLVYRDAKDKLVGAIAERWEIAPDGQTHTFYIRKGVKFHDGSDLTGADVKFSIERLLKPESVGPSQAPQWRAAIEAVELRDDYTVVLRLKKPQFAVLNAAQAGMGAVMPKKYIEEKGEENFRKNPIGSGPWKFVSYDPGNKLVLEAVDSHWRAVPRFERLTLVNVVEEGSRNAMLKTGELDLAPVSADATASLEAAGLRTIGTREGAGNRYTAWMWYDLEHPATSPFGDVRVRKALQLAMNAKEMADKLLRGYGSPFALHGVRGTEDFFDPSRIKVDPFDPEGAKKLLAEAGYPSGFSTKLWDVGGGGEQSIVNLAITGYWNKIGVKTDLTPIDYGALRAKYQPKVVPELWNTTYTLRASMPPGFADNFPSFYHSKTSSIKSFYDPKLDQLIDAAVAAKDQQERTRLEREAAVLAKESYAALAVVEVKGLLGVGAKIGEVGRVEVGGESASLIYETIAHAK